MDVGGGDADLAGNRLGRSAIVTGEQHGSEPERTQLRHRVRRRRLHRVGDHDNPTQAAVPADPDSSTARGLGLVGRRDERCGSGLRPLVREPGPTTHDYGTALRHAGDAAPVVVDERRHHRQPVDGSGTAGCRDDRGRDRVPRGVLERAGQRQDAGGALAICRQHVQNGHLAARHGAGLVQHDGVHASRRLQHLWTLDDDAELRTATRADEQSGGCGEAERARAGDDEYSDSGRERRRSAGTDKEPTGEGGDRQQDHDGDEHRRHAVSQPLHVRLAVLRVFHQASPAGRVACLRQPSSRVRRRGPQRSRWHP